jgi:hypothetical protein
MSDAQEFTYVLFIGCNVQGVPTWNYSHINKVVAHVFDAFTLCKASGEYVYRNLKDKDNSPLVDHEETYVAYISTNKRDQIDRLIKLTKRAYKQECLGMIILPSMMFI